MTNSSIVKKSFKCKVKNCSGAYNYGRGYCAKHYYRIKRYGDPCKALTNPNSIIVDGDLTWVILTDNSLNETGRTVINSNDYEIIKPYKWHLSNTGYAVTNPLEYRNKKIFGMAHVIMGIIPSRKRVIDHIDGNRLNNRKVNLRVCTQKENARNMRLSCLNTSGYKGVEFRNDVGRWVASIRVDGKFIRLKYTDTKEEAAKIYNKYAKMFFGEFACLNNIRQR